MNYVPRLVKRRRVDCNVFGEEKAKEGEVVNTFDYSGLLSPLVEEIDGRLRLPPTLR